MAIALLAIYSLILVWAACTKGHYSHEAFFVNKRLSGSWGIGLSIIVSCVGASATIGMIGMAFAIGTPAFWWLGAGALGLMALALGLAAKVRSTGAYTLPHLVESLLGKEARSLIALIIVIAWLAILAAQFTAIVSVLEPLLNVNPLWCLGLGFFFIVGHSLGGQAAIMRLDKIQAFVLITSLGIMLAWLSLRNPAWPSLSQPEIVNDLFPPAKLLYFLLIVGANYFICPMLFGRLLSAKDTQSAKKGGIIAAFGLLLCAILIVSIGLASKGLIPAHTAQDAVLMSILSDVMPPWLQLVVSLALLSAIVSSADSCLVTAGTILSFDLLKQNKPSVGRLCIFFLGLGGAVLSLWGKGILGFLLMAYDVFACGVVMPVFVALLMYKRWSIESIFACAAIALGGLFGLIAALSGQAMYSYMGLCFSGLLTMYGFLRQAKL